MSEMDELLELGAAAMARLQQILSENEALRAENAYLRSRRYPLDYGIHRRN